ncbi:polysaccharide deacetylase family protein [Wukongibacter baidiensis]|uniref:polysaccharide deacetylase family protein n=1 Tax=Wukongibacter baidiensis TaxID=1723361 RepID=UPI003D7F28D4
MREESTLLISLDFELHWGVSDKKTVEDYSDNLLGARKVVPVILNLFEKYEIHATWGTVGLLFLDNYEEVLEYLPAKKPRYKNEKLSAYKIINDIGSDEKTDPFHYASKLIDKIKLSPNQEISTHTFSHYYCLEEGQKSDEFQEDLDLAIKVAKKKEINIKSIIFPRNQVNKDYTSSLIEKGIEAYRGNQEFWIYKARNQEDETLFRRAVRLSDSYINVSGYNSYSLKDVKEDYPYNLRASRFLRPYSRKLKLLESIRLKRILNEITYAAKNNLVYHLWWHPHNFGANIHENIIFLEKILNHYMKMNKKYGMKSMNMKELAEFLNTERKGSKVK